MIWAMDNSEPVTGVGSGILGWRRRRVVGKSEPLAVAAVPQLKNAGKCFRRVDS
jgi:hypothetical protein